MGKNTTGQMVGGKVFIVVGDNGLDYGDNDRWNVVAYLDEGQATAHAQRATERAQQIRAAYDGYRTGDDYDAKWDQATDGANEHDLVGTWIDPTNHEITYSVSAVALAGGN